MASRRLAHTPDDGTRHAWVTARIVLETVVGFVGLSLLAVWVAARLEMPLFVFAYILVLLAQAL